MAPRRESSQGGRTAMILLAMEDITERRIAERDLRLHKYFSDQSPDPRLCRAGAWWG